MKKFFKAVVGLAAVAGAAFAVLKFWEKKNQAEEDFADDLFDDEDDLADEAKEAAGEVAEAVADKAEEVKEAVEDSAE